MDTPLSIMTIVMRSGFIVSTLVSNQRIDTEKLARVDGGEGGRRLVTNIVGNGAVGVDVGPDRWLKGSL